MKKNKALSRAWFWSYLTWFFGASMPILLFIKTGLVLSIILAILWIGILAMIIVARVFYTKKRPLFPLFGYIAQGANLLLVFTGIVVEIVFSAMGQPAVYAWVFGVLALLGQIVIFITTNYFALKIIHGETIIEGKQ